MPPAKRKVGRPSKLTPEVKKRFLDALSAGNYLETAAAFAGIAKQSVYAWLKRGVAEGKGEHWEFLDAVEKAQAAAETRSVALIAKAAEAQWQASAWMLERKFPKRWGRNTEKLEVTGAAGGPIEVSDARDRLAAELARLLAARSAGAVGPARAEPDSEPDE